MVQLFLTLSKMGGGRAGDQINVQIFCWKFCIILKDLRKCPETAASRLFQGNRTFYEGGMSVNFPKVQAHRFLTNIDIVFLMISFSFRLRNCHFWAENKITKLLMAIMINIHVHLFCNDGLSSTLLLLLRPKGLRSPVFNWNPWPE